MGLFGGLLNNTLNNVVGAIGNTVSGIVGGIVSPISNGIGSITSGAISSLGSSGIMNSSAANIAASSLSGLTGGSSSGGVNTGGIRTMATTSAGQFNTIPWYKKLFNYYKLNATTPILTDSQGNEQFNFTTPKELDLIKILTHITILLTFGVGAWYLLKKKKRKY